MKEQAYTLPVYKTRDYSIFNKLAGNRELNQIQVKRLVKALESDNEFTRNNPIIVNEIMEVIDGQHRIAAFDRFSKTKKENPDLYYVVVEGATLTSAMRLNSGAKPWLPIDYARAYSEQGNKNYSRYVELAEKYPLPHAVIVCALEGKRLQSGTVRFRKGEFTAVFKDAEAFLDRLMDTKEFVLGWRKEGFGTSLIEMMRNKGYDHERMLSQLKKYGEGLINVPNRKNEVKAALNMIYNWSRRDKVDLMSN